MMRKCGSFAMASMALRVIRDLPIPASPANSTIWPSPALAWRQRSSSKDSSCSRPTIGKSSLAVRASKRLSRARVPSTENTVVGTAMPLRCCAPRSASSKCSPKSVRVVSLITTCPGVASACRRAAKFGVSPTTASSCDAPSPIKSPTTTKPVLIPIRAAKDSPLGVFRPASA